MEKSIDRQKDDGYITTHVLNQPEPFGKTDLLFSFHYGGSGGPWGS